MHLIHNPFEAVAGDVIEVRIDRAANVQFLDEVNYELYKSDRGYRYAGGNRRKARSADAPGAAVGADPVARAARGGSRLFHSCPRAARPGAPQETYAFSKVPSAIDHGTGIVIQHPADQVVGGQPLGVGLVADDHPMAEDVPRQALDVVRRDVVAAREQGVAPRGADQGERGAGARP